MKRCHLRQLPGLVKLQPADRCANRLDRCLIVVAEPSLDRGRTEAGKRHAAVGGFLARPEGLRIHHRGQHEPLPVVDEAPQAGQQQGRVLRLLIVRLLQPEGLVEEGARGECLQGVVDPVPASDLTRLIGVHRYAHQYSLCHRVSLVRSCDRV